MSVLPIVDRELRVAARRPGTYWMRFWTALMMLAIWAVLLAKSQSVSSGQMGQHLLNALGFLALAFSALTGVFLTSDCLSEEKREGTLGLLFLTDLKAWDIVLGKLAAGSLHAFFGLLAVFPILGLTMLVGGVTGPEFWRLALVFVTTLFFSLSVGMVVSTVSRDARQAVTGAFLSLLFFTGILPAIWWLHWLNFRTTALDFLLLPSPPYAYIKAFDVRYRSSGGAHEFWWSEATVMALGFLGIVIANIVLPRVWQDAVTTDLPAKKRFQLPNRRPLSFRVARNWLEPMFWLFVRDRAPRVTARRALFCLIPIWLTALVASVLVPRAFSVAAFITALFSSFALHQVIKVLVATEASRRMNQDRRSGAWELLLVTPMRVETILEAQQRALRRHFFGAILVLCGVNWAMMAVAFTFSKQLEIDAGDGILFGEMFIGGMVALVVDFYAIGWVGMWWGLKAKQHHRAVMATLGQLMLAPWIILFLLFFLQPNFGPGSVPPMIVMGLWFFSGIATDVVSMLIARKRLLKEFRTVVSGGGRRTFG